MGRLFRFDSAAFELDDCTSFYVLMFSCETGCKLSRNMTSGCTVGLGVSSELHPDFATSSVGTQETSSNSSGTLTITLTGGKDRFGGP